MKNISIRRSAAFFCALLLLFTAGCAQAPNTSESSAIPTADPLAQSILYTAVPTPTASPTAKPTSEPTAEPTVVPETDPEITVEVETMYPLLKAHVLAQLNGGSFDGSSPEYFWQTVAFAIDGCGLDFYTSETVGNALTLSRGVIEEIASGLFENGGTVLPEIPESLSGEIQYDKEADAFAHPLSEGSFIVVPTFLNENKDGSLTLTADFFAGDSDTAAASFTAVLVPNARSGNSLFTLSVRSVILEV